MVFLNLIPSPNELNLYQFCLAAGLLDGVLLEVDGAAYNFELLQRQQFLYY